MLSLWFVCPTEKVNMSKYDYKDIEKKLKCFVLQFLSNCPPFEMLTDIEGLLGNATL